MQGIILVGGAGKRLRPLTYHTPKPMLPIVERPMIARVVDWLASYGVDRVVLALGYRPDPFVEAFPDGECAGVELGYVVEPEPLDTAGAIRLAAEQGELSGETIVVLNGDVLTDLDLGSLIRFHAAHGGEASIALTPVADPSAYGVVPTDDDGRVLAFIEKPPRESAPTNLVNAGSYVLEPSVLERIEAGRRVSIERETFPELVGRQALFALASDAYWLDTGTPDRYIRAQLDVLGGRRPSVALPLCAEVSPGVFVAPDARFEGKSSGCAFVGSAASVADGALVEDAVVGSGASVGAGATVRHSVLLPGSVVAEGALVDHSIIGPGASVGAGATLRASTVIGAGYAVAEGADLDGHRLPE